MALHLHFLNRASRFAMLEAACERRSIGKKFIARRESERLLASTSLASHSH
jgi:hypothetical protein